VWIDSEQSGDKSRASNEQIKEGHEMAAEGGMYFHNQ